MQLHMVVMSKHCKRIQRVRKFMILYKYICGDLFISYYIWMLDRILVYFCNYFDNCLNKLGQSSAKLRSSLISLAAK